jgi:hypothetical protein
MTPATHAFITPSYAGDLERFRLQCESMDKMARGNWRHYVLIADDDIPLFKSYRNERRIIIPDSVILPSWLQSFRKPFNKSGRKIWLKASLGRPLWPMSGWHVQQLRKMLISRHISEPFLVMVDSDSFFVRPFGIEHFLINEKLRLYKKNNAILDSSGFAKHHEWVKQSAQILGIDPEPLPAHDYIANLVTWRRDYALQMLDHIEKLSGRDFVSTMGRHRTFSEYQIYGSFVERVLRDEQQPCDNRELTQTHWGEAALKDKGIKSFMSDIRDYQIAIGVQSFTETSIDLLREAYLGMSDKLR